MPNIDDAHVKLGQARALADLLMAATHPQGGEENPMLAMLDDSTLHWCASLQFELICEAMDALDSKEPARLKAVQS